MSSWRWAKMGNTPEWSQPRSIIDSYILLTGVVLYQPVVSLLKLMHFYCQRLGRHRCFEKPRGLWEEDSRSLSMSFVFLEVPKTKANVKCLWWPTKLRPFGLGFIRSCVGLYFFGQNDSESRFECFHLSQTGLGDASSWDGWTVPQLWRKADGIILPSGALEIQVEDVRPIWRGAKDHKHSTRETCFALTKIIPKIRLVLVA